MKESKEMVTGQDFILLMRTADVSRVLHVHSNTVRRWSDLGVLKSYRIGNRGDRRFYREDVNRFLLELRSAHGDARKAAYFCSLSNDMSD